MSQLGERLRQCRESRGLSLAQVALETRIIQQSLAALEEGAYERLPGDVVTRGFIRNYGQYLGLPVEELIELYRRERGKTDKIQIVRATNPPRTRAYALPGFFGVFFVTLALVGLTYVTLNAVGRIGGGETVAMMATATAPAATPTNLPAQVTAARAAAPTIPALPPGAAAAPAGAAASAGPTATPQAPIVVEVSIPSGGRSWLLVEIDGREAYKQTMNPGERETFQARRQIYIRAGNPTIVQVSVNGLQQGPIGLTPGRPVDWYWPPR